MIKFELFSFLETKIEFKENHIVSFIIQPRQTNIFQLRPNVLGYICLTNVKDKKIINWCF